MIEQEGVGAYEKPLRRKHFPFPKSPTIDSIGIHVAQETKYIQLHAFD